MSRSKGSFTPDAAPHRNATQRTAFSVNNHSVFNMIYYCGATGRNRDLIPCLFNAVQFRAGLFIKNADPAGNS